MKIIEKDPISYLREISAIRTNVAKRRHQHGEILELQERAAKKFAELNGWRLLRTTFKVTDIGGARTGHADIYHARLLDHGLYFRKAGDCIAIAAQIYDLKVNLPHIEALAKGLGLCVQMPPQVFASIHNPGGAAFVVVTEPGIKVRWLSEQISGN